MLSNTCPLCACLWFFCLEWHAELSKSSTLHLQAFRGFATSIIRDTRDKRADFPTEKQARSPEIPKRSGGIRVTRITGCLNSIVGDWQILRHSLGEALGEALGETLDVSPTRTLEIFAVAWVK